jgi:hypothetical protein
MRKQQQQQTIIIEFDLLLQSDAQIFTLSSKAPEILREEQE